MPTGSVPGSGDPARPVGEPVVEHALSLGFVPYGSSIGRVSSGTGTIWVDLPLPDRACVAAVRGASVAFLDGSAPAVAPVSTGGAWMLRDDGSLDHVTADRASQTVADGTRTGYPEGVPPARADERGGRRPRLLAAAPDGGAWLVSGNRGRPLRVTPGGKIAAVEAHLRDDDEPVWVVPAPDGGAWLAVPNGRAVVRLAPDGTATRLDAENASPDLVVGDGADGVWFADQAAGIVGHLSATGRRDVTVRVDGVTDLAFGPDGSPWFVDAAGIGTLREGTVERFGLPPVGRSPGTMFHPVSIAADHDGSLVFSEYFYGGEGSTAYLGRVRFDGGPPGEPGAVAGGSTAGGCAARAAGGPAPPTTDGSPPPPSAPDPDGSTTTTGPP